MSEKLKNPLTRRGYNRLAEEHRHLLEEVRPKVVRGVADAAAEGDRSENAEYIYGRKRLREIDKKLRYLTGLLKDAQVIDPEYQRGDRVDFSATVVVRDDEGRSKAWTIVGVGEADANEGTISWKSPLARALMGKKIGDVIWFERPAGEVELEIIDVMYDGRSIGGTSRG